MPDKLVTHACSDPSHGIRHTAASMWYQCTQDPVCVSDTTETLSSALTCSHSVGHKSHMQAVVMAARVSCMQ